MEESTTNNLQDPTAPDMVAERLIAIRESLNLSKTDFARMIGVDKSSYTKMEKGVKPLLPPNAQLIWKHYNIDMNFTYLGQYGGLPSSLSSKIINHLNGE